MNAIKYFKVDSARNKMQFLYMLIFSLLSFVLSLKVASPYFGLMYMIFGSIIFSTVPFTLDQMSQAGFINMLPGTTRSRVVGRFLFAVSMVLLGTALGTIILAVYSLINKENVEYVLALIVGAAGLGLLICSLQYILFYLLGKIKSVQAMGIVRMVPAFVMFFGISRIAEWISENPGDQIEWLLDNANEVAIGLLGAGLILCILGIFISSAVVARRDYE